MSQVTQWKLGLWVWSLVKVHTVSKQCVGDLQPPRPLYHYYSVSGSGGP